jgi:hypothetical protein
LTKSLFKVLTFKINSLLHEPLFYQEDIRLHFFALHLIKIVCCVVELSETDQTPVRHLAGNPEQAALDQVERKEGNDGASAHPPQHALQSKILNYD